MVSSDGCGAAARAATAALHLTAGRHSATASLDLTRASSWPKNCVPWISRGCRRTSTRLSAPTSAPLDFLLRPLVLTLLP